MELPGRRELREQILHQMDGRTSYVSDADVYREIDKAILRSGHSGYGTLSEKEELRRQMFSSIRGFDVLEKYLEDSSISEIMVIGASHIFVEQNGRVRRTRDHFFEEADVYRLIEQIVAPTNRMVNEASPIVDSRLPDGSRVHIVLPPISLEGHGYHYSKVFKRRNDHCKITRFWRISRSAYRDTFCFGEGKVQYFDQWGDKLREVFALECTCRIYRTGGTSDHNRRFSGTPIVSC